jgi:GTP-binding protein HflX
VLAEDKLFATLDTRSRRLRFPEEREVVITDTVGFIRDLPKDLFSAFRATFEEAADADLLLHVIDASDPARDTQIETTEALLSELGLGHIPRILVYNKVDLLPKEQARLLGWGRSDRVAISATDRETTRDLLGKIAERLAVRWEEAATVPRFDEEPEGEGDGQETQRVPEPDESTPELTSLSDLLGWSRRSRTARA